MIDRRIFLQGLTALGCSAAAHPLITTMTLAGDAATLGENRLVVVVLRGAMDGLDVVRPFEDPLLATYRPTLARGNGLALSQGFALHPALGGLSDLWQRGELGFVHAVSTPYRDKRSHFDGQDLLEAGTSPDVPRGTARDGWLNRMLQAVPGLRAETAWAVGRDPLPVIEGMAPVRSWSPDLRLDLSAQNRRLLGELYHDDPLFRDVAAEALELAAAIPGAAEGGARGRKGKGKGNPFADIDGLAGFAAERLRGEARIAAFSLSGWDTHRSQARSILKPLSQLERLLLRLRDGLGPAWERTAVLAMTEFGRTARENGSGGTDHGTAGAMLVAGGAVRGGQVMGRWPGLGDAALYAGRDLMPTSDVRAWAAWTMRALYGFDRGLLEGSVFPGLDMGDDPGLVL
ncbi:DUF1501 domain-containing protein [Rhodobacter sp. CZR27]|uniref:DUF1501 domain-containing protein n=1 Tax=Rhodobacter sp. CZR27 TaxID=2033869 RepID=UPI000BBE841B|nr:DUF1501 domain-containing protein [Rhodobacter sp. CZR27]